MKRAAMQRTMQPILFILAIVVITALMTTPPIVAEPLLTPRPPIADVGDEALEIAEKATQMVDWLLNGDDGNDADKSESSARMGPGMPGAEGYPRGVMR